MEFFRKICLSLLTFIIFLITKTGNLYGQNTSESNLFNFSNLIEELAETTDDTDAIQQIVNDLNDLLNHPIDINSASEKELQRIFLLNDFQVKSLLNYRAEYGNFLSLNELLLVPGIQPDLYHKISQFLSTSDNNSEINYNDKPGRIKSDLIVRYKTRFEVPAGFSEDVDSIRKFAGKPHYLMTRYELSSGKKYKAGFVTEKDSGEPMFSAHNKYSPDHIAGFFEFNSAKKPLKIIIGDFKAGFGQGLVSGHSFMAKASNGILLPETNKIIRSLSTAESGYLRGVAMQTRAGLLSVSSYLSWVKLDASIKDYISENDSLQYFSSINKSGLHRNLAEIKNRNTLRQMNAGVDLTYSFKFMSLGIYGEKVFFNLPMELSAYEQGSDPNWYASDFYNYSIHYKASLPKAMIFGEWAIDRSGQIAVLNGLTAQLHPLVALSMLHRKYSPFYRSFNATGFGKTSSVKNEEGFYLGIHAYPFSFLGLSCYADHYKFPYPGSNISPPSSGSDYMINAVFMVGRESQFTFRYKVSNQEVKTSRDETGIDMNNKNSLSSWRLVSQYNINESIVLETRFEQTENKLHPHYSSKGYYLGQKLILKAQNKKLSFYSSYGLFDAADWKNRIYVYEHDLLYDFSIPALYRKGSRLSLMIKTRINDQCGIWIKYYLTHYPNPVERGSGADKVISDKDSGFKFQLRIKL